MEKEQPIKEVELTSGETVSVIGFDGNPRETLERAGNGLLISYLGTRKMDLFVKGNDGIYRLDKATRFI